MRLKILSMVIVAWGFGLAGPAAAEDPPTPFCSATPANLTAGVYTLRLSNGKSLDAEGWGSFVNGTPVQGWDFHGGPNQRWLITPAGEGRYLVRSAAVAKAIDAAFGWLITWRTNRGAGQLWRIEAARGMHRLRLAEGGRQLGLSGDIRVNGARARTDTPGCGAHQLWRLTRVSDYREVGRAEGIGRLMSIAVRLNNYTPIRNQFDGSGERAYFKPNDSSVAFQFGARRVAFPVPLPVLEVGPDRMFKTYVNDWNSNWTTIAGESGRLRFGVGFEDTGVEIITNCYNNFNCHVGEPRFDFRNTVLNVFVRPRFDAAAGRFTFDAETRFSTDIAESGPCVNNFWAFLCDAFAPNRQSQVRDSLVRTVDANLTQGVGRAGLELVLNELARGTSLRNVTVGDDAELIFF